MADLNVIKIRNLYKSFGDFKVLDDISLDIKESENLVVFGRSGTGKSVLLKCIIGLLEPDAGTVEVFGQKVNGLKKKELNTVRRRLSFLFQGAALYDSMSVRENLEFPLVRNFNYTQAELNDKVMHTLEDVGLVEAVDKMPAELSGGMRKRIGLARSIISEPEIMFYDEPTTGLDPLTSKEISLLILELQQKLKMTSIVVTHDLNCADIIADRAVFLKDAKMIFEGDLKNLVNSEDKFLKNFFSNEIITD